MLVRTLIAPAQLLPHFFLAQFLKEKKWEHELNI